MKKIVYMLALGAAFAGMTGCSGEKKNNVDGREQNVTRDLKFESFTYDMIGEDLSVDTTLIESESERLIRFTGQGVLPQDIGGENIHQLRDSLMRMARVEFDDEYRPAPLLLDSIEITGLAPRDTDACGYAYSTLAVTLVTPRVVVWQAYREVYQCMAAHGEIATEYLNYSMTDGRIVRLGDIFVADYRKPLEKAIRAKLREMGVDLLVKPYEVGISDQFEITPDGVNFSYDPYVIAPFSEGTIKVELSTGDLEDILSPEGLRLITGS